MLYKQILSDTNTLSFIAEGFETDDEVLESLNIFYDVFNENILDEDLGIINLLRNIDKFSYDGILYKE